MQPYILPEYDRESPALLACNPYNPDFPQRFAFVSASESFHGLTADRTEFLGRMGGLSRPAGLGRIGLSGAVRPGPDPCAAVQVHLNLEPGGSRTVHFLLGQGADREEALRLAREYRQPAAAQAAWREAREGWEELLGAVQVRTPEPSMDLLLNRWLPYQNLACRFWGRSGFYQSGGAFGFRDQLQDSLALLHLRPDLTREHLLRAARHQFEAGDVLHWWHPPRGRGVRTRVSDDLLWLPFVTAHYVEVTGDRSVLREQVPYLRADVLGPEEEERYGLFGATPESVHPLRALPAGPGQGGHRRPPRAAPDGRRGLERRHEPGGDRRQGGKRLAGLVPVRLPDPLRSALRLDGRRRRGGKAPPAGGGAARGPGGERLGRGLVPAGLVRRRHPPGFGAQPGVPHRLRGPVLGGPVRGRGPAAGAPGDGSRWPSCSCAPTTG